MVDIVRATIGGLRGPAGNDGVSDIPGPAGSVEAYSGTLTSTGSSRTFYRAETPDFIDGGGDNNRGDAIMGVAINNFAANHEGSGAPYAYRDYVVSWANNLTATGARPNADAGGSGWFIEGKFWQVGTFATEVQLRHYMLDDTPKRPIQWFLPETTAAARGSADMSFQIDKIGWNDWLGVQVMQTRLDQKTWDMIGGMIFRFDNNRQVISQRNAANSAPIFHPYINQHDFYLSTAPKLSQGAEKLNPDYNVTAWDIAFTSGQVTNGFHRVHVGTTAVTGSYTADDLRFSVSGNLINRLENSGAGKAVYDLIAATGGAEYRANGIKVVGDRQAAVANAAAPTYVAPSGGATTDAEARTAIAQLAADNAALRTMVIALADRLRPGGHGLIA